MRMSGIVLVLSVATSTCVGTVCGSQKVTDVEATIHINGFDRTYLVHRPPGFNSSKALTVVMMLHGRGGSSHLAARDFGWIEKSDKEGLPCCFPSSLTNRSGSSIRLTIASEFHTRLEYSDERHVMVDARTGDKLSVCSQPRLSPRCSSA